MISVAICDDEIGTCSEIEKTVTAYGDSHGLQIETECFYTGEELYRWLQEQGPIDLIFLDIQLLALDGVQVGRQIREQLGNEKISIVYISSRETYAMSLFQVRPLDFLIKPITTEKTFGVLDKFVRLHGVTKKEFYYKAGKTTCRLYLDEIRYFACNGKKVEIYTVSGRQEYYGTMQEVWKQAEGKGFWIIHKSYIINTSFVSVFHYDSVQMTDGTHLPVSQRYRKAVKENLTVKYRME